MKIEPHERIRIGDRVTIYRRGRRMIYTAEFHFRGRHCRRSLKTTVKRIATRLAIKIESELDAGTYLTATQDEHPPAQRTNIHQAGADFIQYCETEGLRRKTVVKYRGILDRFVEFAEGEGKMRLDKVDLRLIDGYRAHRRPRLSQKSMHHEAVLLKSFLGWCADRRLIYENPLAKQRFTAPRAIPRGGPTLEQVNAILGAASEVRYPVIATAAFAGLRIGEIARLRVEDVDFNGNWLHVVSRPSYETKSGQSWKVPMHDRLRKILATVQNAKSDWFFTAMPSRKYPLGGHSIAPKHVNEDFLKVLRKLEIHAGRNDGFTFHSLRSSFKTLCISAGIPREVVDAWQNHAPDRAASNVYYKLADKDSQRFMSRVPFGE